MIFIFSLVSFNLFIHYGIICRQYQQYHKIIKATLLFNISKSKQLFSSHNKYLMQQKGELNNLRIIINKLRLLIQLQLDNSTDEQKWEPRCLSQATRVLIQRVLHIFKQFRSEQSHDATNGTEPQQRITKQLIGCDQIVKLLQIKIIDAVESMMKIANIQQENNKDSQIEQLYQQFYILCSQYLSKSYDQSNKLCLLLSHQVHSLSTDSKENSAKLQQKSLGQPIKVNHSPDYFLLKHILQKVYHAKKTFQAQRLVLQYQINELRMQTQQQKIEISNLINSKEELAEDVSELQEALQKGLLENAKKILMKRSITKKQQEEVQKQKKLSASKRTDDNIGSISRQIQQQISMLRAKNEQLIHENDAVKQKIEEYKGQLYRSAWIISMQNRQINLNLQKIREYQKRKAQFNIDTSIVSFNPEKRGKQFRVSNASINQSIEFQNGIVKNSNFPPPQNLFQVVNIHKIKDTKLKALH